MSSLDWLTLTDALSKYGWNLTANAEGKWVLSEEFACFDGPEEVLDWIKEEFIQA